MESTTSNERHVSIRMPADLWDALDELARESERKPSAEIRLALKRWVDPDAVKERNGK